MKVIALDLEGTLISNAVSQIPRPWLYEFLISCESITEKIVIFTAVSEPIFRSIAKFLVEENFAPQWFEKIEYVLWEGKTKNLNFVDPCLIERVVLVDDFKDYIHVGQEESWVQIDTFASPYDENDVELWRVYKILLEKCKSFSGKDRGHMYKNNLPLRKTFDSWRTAKIEYAANELMDGDCDAAIRWLQTPLEIFGGQPPIEHALSKFGENEVMNLIGRLADGVFT